MTIFRIFSELFRTFSYVKQWQKITLHRFRHPVDLLPHLSRLRKNMAFSGVQFARKRICETVHSKC